MPQVYFIGAGPGDPDLITVKGMKVLGQAQVVIYADSLVNPEVLKFARPDAEIHKSAAMNLEETTAVIEKAVAEGKLVARLQTGEPSLYGAIGEQMAELDKRGIEYAVIPGVSSLFASAAALKTELTIPEVSQTVVITRLAGRTPVPENEALHRLAANGGTLAVFLSSGMVSAVVAELLKGGRTAETPVAVVYRASWPEEKVIRTTIANLASDVSKAGISRQALIIVGDVLAAKDKGLVSKLYDKGFSHGYR
ncbi:precorrin-4/cobalt-precorrin-4 C11-methyltransferase [Dehalogenimonas formicexedens]|uniref:Precorrin-4/cobalt-precorrin-4 C11-methyltransferase n=1 Tax=Dehalogenimonas formicexedens TaxID=1839801 RepID=A0A1P8F9H1_9CHLR|nr:precorrin-4 C(11)-methyltransferase [Dehalogenimonas formicexedens]APV45098.1 precorrin-4/cobalt-precorrin-4 C11-methyltransferase [Dehalogenimonas formicexedens]